MPLPSERELMDAIQGVWLEVRYSVGPTRFREYLRGREKACILRNYRQLEEVWRRYEKSLATEPARREAGKTAAKYVALQRVVASMTLPASVTTYDPTLKGDIGIGDPPKPGIVDPDFFWDELAQYRALTDANLTEQLQGCGWSLPPVLRPLAKCGA
jgi:hypothetical protein